MKKNKIFCLVFLAALVSLEIMELNSTCSIFKGILEHYSLGVLGMFFVAKERLPKVLFLVFVLTVFSFGANSTFASSPEVARVLFGGKQTYHDYNTWGKNGHDNASRSDGYYGGHSGIDIQTTTKSIDDIFYSVSRGKVIKAGGDNCNGIYVYDEIEGVTAIYLHASQVLVSNDQTVSVGQPLGKQGRTGPGVTGIHVHLEFRDGKQTAPATGKGTTRDPVATAMSYIKAQTLPPEKPSLPGYRDGVLLKGSKPDVYVIQGGKKCLIPDPATFKHMGFSWNAIRKIPDEVLQQIPNGQPLSSVKTQKAKKEPVQKQKSIQVGATVTVTNTGGIGLRLRSSPGLKDSNPTIANLPDGTRMKVIGGPVQADGYTWWRLQGNPGTGWSVGNWLVP